MKLFVSYSHQDEKYREQLDIHLSMLKKSGTVSSWTDKKIIPSQNWADEIDVNLEAAGVVILLVSSDFISSHYCYEIEMKRALERHEENKARVLPIIIRPCDWEDAPFGNLQALPREAKAISQWRNKDSAWKDVINGLKKTIKAVNELNEGGDKQVAIWPSPLTAEFSHLLNDTEVELKHRRVDHVMLSDVFIWPDLKVLNDDIDRIAITIGAKEILQKRKWSLVFGDEQSGKTTLSKYYFREAMNLGFNPVIVQGEEIKSSDIKALLDKKIAQQYSSVLGFHESTKKILIVDNFSNCQLNKKYQSKLLDNIKAEFEKIILIATESYQYVSPEIDSLDEFSCYEILSFGVVKRTELIEKWVSMGIVEELDEESLYSEVDEIKLKIESLTRGGVLPSKPVFLLTLLQMLETLSPQKVEMTSYGHCYQYLIYQSLEKVRVKNSDVDKYINFLTEFGNAQFNNKGAGLDQRQLDEFYEKYSSIYLSLPKDEMIRILTNSSILIRRNDRLIFKYSYIYYFFAAKKLAESFPNDQSAKNTVQRLLTNLHREDCSNIIIFITHHSKDDWILDEIQLCLMELFDEQSEACLEKESLGFMIDFLNEIPDLVIEHRNVEAERRKHDENLEKLENKQKNEREAHNNLEPTDMLAKINRAFKGIEIIGQIIRNRHGSLERGKLEQLAAQAYGVGLRFLQFFLTISDSSKEEVISLIENCLRENPSIANEKVEKEAKSIFMQLTYGAIYGVLRKISVSVGSKEAELIYKKIEKDSPSPAVKLINQAIYLQFNKSLETKFIKLLAKEFVKNPTCERMLKEIVIQHIYMFPVEYKHKQQIAEILNISVEGQLKLGLQKNFSM